MANDGKLPSTGKAPLSQIQKEKKITVEIKGKTFNDQVPKAGGRQVGSTLEQKAENNSAIQLIDLTQNRIADAKNDYARDIQTGFEARIQMLTEERKV